jgi:hypothetical protein
MGESGGYDDGIDEFNSAIDWSKKSLNKRCNSRSNHILVWHEPLMAAMKTKLI